MTATGCSGLVIRCTPSPFLAMMIKPSLTNIDNQAVVMVYPSYATELEDGSWKVRIVGSVFGEDDGDVGLQKRLLLKLFARVLKARPDQLESDLFQERIRGFILNAERGKRVAIRIGSHVFRLKKKSKRNGQFAGTVRLSRQQMIELTEGDPWLNFNVLTRGNQEVDGGQVHLLDRHGVSVISDIDDTMKHTGVGCRKSLLANTFLNEFENIDGMAAVYRRWAELGANFHYVSSSPWQLFEPLLKFCKEHDFPAGTFHLRQFRLRDHMLRRLLLVRRGKGTVIKRLIKTCSQRQFVLIGDSGEKDPEIYGKIARRFPDQIAGIYIRDLPNRPLDSMRRKKAFQNLPGPLCNIFRDANELPDDILIGAAHAV